MLLLVFWGFNRAVLQQVNALDIETPALSAVQDDAMLSALREHNLPGEWSTVPLFYGRGTWDLEKMTWIDRTLCRMLQKSLQKKPPEACDPGMETIKNAAGPCNWTDRSYLVPLLRFLEEPGAST